MAHKDHPQRRQGSQRHEQDRRFYNNGEFDQDHDQDSPSGDGPQDSQREYNQRSWQQGAFGSQAGRGVGDGNNRNTPDAGHHNPDGYYGQGDTGQRRYEPSRDAQHQEPFDPDYRQWRNEQMQSLDDDYRNWRRDRYKKFADEFSTWRSSRDKSAQGSGAGSEDPSRSNATGSGADKTK
jgi:hypothetical protein